MYQILLDIAKQDLVAAELLYKEHLYPQAVFFLQQGVEKAAKAFALMTKIVTENEVKKAVGHNPLKIHKKVLERQNAQQQEFSELCNRLPGLRKTRLYRLVDIDKRIEESDRFKEVLDSIFKDKPVFLSKDDIQECIHIIGEFQSEIENVQSGKTDLTIGKAERSEIRDYLEDFYKALEPYNPADMQQVKQELADLDLQVLTKAIVESIPLLLEPAYIHMALFYLSLITFPHAILSRYPDSGINPIEFYSCGLPLVDMFGECILVIRNVLKRIRNLNDFIDSG